MALIGAGTFLALLSGYRSCWISGKWGGGKTSLAFYLAMPFLEKGYRLITNSRCIWADDMEQLEWVNESGHLKAFVVIDEGGVDIESSKQVKAYMAYAAKMDIITMIPSGTEPPPEAKKLVVQVVFNFSKIGIPLIVYHWRLRWGEAKDNGIFLWLDPSPVYGVYSRQDPGEDAAEIMAWLVDKAQAYRAFHGRSTKRVSSLEATQADLFQDAARTLREAVEYVSLPKRRNGRRWP